jgi:hypothetical protein
MDSGIVERSSQVEAMTGPETQNIDAVTCETSSAALIDTHHFERSQLSTGNGCS